MYTFKRTEKNKPIAEEYETRAMLYLMNKIQDIEIDLFLIDSFNDVSGADQHFNYIIDLQSKGVKNFPPSKIGESLITLFLNHISDFSFDEYILFCRCVENKLLGSDRISGLTCHNFDSLNKDAIKDIKKSLFKLVDKELGEGYIKSLNKNIIESFFEKLYIVIDDGEKSQHIKNILPMQQLNKLNDDNLMAIFKDITDKRVSLKTNINLEGQKIINISDCLIYKKFLQRKTIESLVVSRLVGYDIFNDNNSIPIYFSPYTNNLNIEEKVDIIQKVNSEVSKAFFDINNSKAFFEFIDNVMEEVKVSKNIDKVLGIIKKNGVAIPPQLTEISAKYLISMIMGGLYDNQ